MASVPSAKTMSKILYTKERGNLYESSVLHQSNEHQITVEFALGLPMREQREEPCTSVH